MQKQREDIKQALILGMMLKKNLALLKARASDENLLFPVNQMQVEAHYSMMINNITQTNAKLFKSNGTIDKRRKKRFGLKVNKSSKLIKAK